MRFFLIITIMTGFICSSSFAKKLPEAKDIMARNDLNEDSVIRGEEHKRLFNEMKPFIAKCDDYKPSKEDLAFSAYLYILTFKEVPNLAQLLKFHHSNDDKLDIEADMKDLQWGRILFPLICNDKTPDDTTLKINY